MKLKLWFNSGANIHSKNSQTADTMKDFGLTDEEWAEISDEEKEKLVLDWWWESGYLDYGFEEVAK